MKWGFLFFTFFLFLLGCSSIERSPQSLLHKDIHIVLDIDWTIVSNFEDGISKIPDNKIITVEGKKYIPREGISELVESLLKRGVKVSFFSGGSFSRNNELLSKINLQNGKTLLEVAYKVKSFDDLTRVPDVPENARFALKYKKDLLKITDDLDNIVLIDDTYNFFVDESQKNNLIRLGPTFKYFEHFDETTQMAGEYIPKTLEEFQFDRMKLIVLNKQIDEAINLSEQDGIDFKTAMNEVSKKFDLESGNWNLYTLPILKSYKNKKIPKVDLSNSCLDTLQPFLSIK